MKNYKKGLLCVMVLSAMSLMAAEDKTLYVNTFDDEDGENLNKCSLREAIKTAQMNKAYGGCGAGNTSLGQGDRIQLEEGEYILKSELRPASQITISGKLPVDYSSKDVLTNEYPATVKLKTKISAQGNSRIFNTLDSQSVLGLEYISLENGKSTGGGGALLLGGPLNLSHSAILNSKSDQEGGAIYFVAQNTEKKIDIRYTLIEGNDAKRGSVIAMDCEANLLNTQPTLSIINSSIVKNGSPTSLSTIDICGNPKVSLSANTIAQNVANSTNGHIIYAVNGINHKLSSAYVFTAFSNTIVENNAFSTFYYDNNGIIGLSFNILAYNQGKSCRYALNNGNVKDVELPLVASQNALQLNAGVGQCDLPEKATSNSDNSNKNKDLSGISLATVLSPLQTASKYNLFLPMYYPKDNQNDTDLVNIGDVKGCSEIDQRGVTRVTEETLMLNPTLKNTCDIGSIELMRLTATDVSDLKNQSYATLIENYQKNIDVLKEYLANPENNQDYIEKDKEDLKAFEGLLKYTKQYAQYRPIYVDPFALALPTEELVSTDMNGPTQLRALNTSNYNVSTRVYGVGAFIEKNGAFEFVGKEDPNLKCEWKADLKRIIIYRLDGKADLLEGSGYCSYTLTSNKVGDSSTSSGILGVSFSNMAPIAKNDTYSITPSSNTVISVNPLTNDSDDGDGVTTHLNVPYIGKFYKNADGVELPIKLGPMPPGLTVTADRSGPCPGNNIKDTCYGGQLRFEVKNSFSQFDYEIKYTIFDAEGLISNEATIDLINTVKNTNSTASGGGGSIGLWSILGLIGLGLYRSRRKYV